MNEEERQRIERGDSESSVPLVVAAALLALLLLWVAGSCDTDDGSWRDPTTWVGK